MKTVLVIGAYGMIGSGIVRALRAEGHRVIGLGRNRHAALRAFPMIDWFIQDLDFMTEPRAWADVLDEVEFVVNCAGTHGIGGRVEAELVHHSAVAALASICADTGIGLIHMSCAGASVDSSDPHLRHIGAGDAAVAVFGGEYWILRPGLVLGEGASAPGRVLRALAAVRLFRLTAFARRRVQTVALPDLADAVLQCLDGDIAAGTIADIVEAEPQAMTTLIRDLRVWLGIGPGGLPLHLPAVLLWPLALGGTVLATLGWRPALQLATLRRLSRDVLGDPAPWVAAGGDPPRPMARNLAMLPATSDTRAAAGLAQLLPLIVILLALITGTSGVASWFEREALYALLEGTGLPQNLRDALVYGTVFIQVSLGMMLLMRRTARMAAWGVITLALIFLVAATRVVPTLWFDPMVPLLNLLAVIMLGVIVLIALPRR
ncbi:NAD-dependent epimerase/dehydratase family protein [Rhodalgimonas zhirmunskyi]|uniref:SDR family oxidoreductase n=1 Tax=Rhodalgimonas zhirmunskyi TaxID=2964767 RepID=A0AAJ1U9M4_9RHOB|nr:NAD-dependent epimerase/dehydratase family protein [Rhodoalgimonas zhirmunskyi]MDQ2093733.1 SDR family oxidoreductase [Rhodoalgimonas zhirmunskyi]